MKLILAGLVGLTLMLVACGKSSDPGEDTGSFSQSTFRKSYDISSFGCATGKHVFTGDNENEVFRDYCYELRDGAKNEYCAEDYRKQLFESQRCDDTYAWN